MENHDWTKSSALAHRLRKLSLGAHNFKSIYRLPFQNSIASSFNARLLVLCVATALFLLLCPNDSAGQTNQAGKAPTSDVQYLYGSWYSYPPGNPATDPIRHEFRHNRTKNVDEIVVTRLCPGDYRAVIARATSSIEITASTIRVLKHTSDTEKGEIGSECKADIDPGLWSYTLSNDHNRLTITNPGGTPDIMELARQDSTSASVLPSNLYGTWSFPTQSDGNLKKVLRLVFYNNADTSEGKVREIATCIKGNDTLVSQVDANIEVSSDQIKILNSASHTQKQGPFTCEATITSGTLNYSVSSTGNNMKLRSATGAEMTLTREAEAGLN
jgi:hypothetical protein